MHLHVVLDKLLVSTEYFNGSAMKPGATKSQTKNVSIKAPEIITNSAAGHLFNVANEKSSKQKQTEAGYIETQLKIPQQLEVIAKETSEKVVPGIDERLRVCHEPIPPYLGSFATKNILHLGKWLSLSSEEYSISYCPIPKAMSTMGKTIMQILEKRLSLEKGIVRDYNFNDPRGLLIKLIDTPDSLFGLELKDIQSKIVIIRDPVERFISAWLDICGRHPIECSKNCGNDLNCFIIQLYKHLWKISGMPTVLQNRIPELGTMDFHFYPQNWWCDLKNKNKLVNKIIYDESIIGKIFAVFKNAGIREKHLLELRQLKLLRPNPTFEMKGERERIMEIIYSNNTLFRCIMNMFAGDYETMKFSII